MLLPWHSGLVRSTSAYGGTQFDEDETEENRRIASLHVHAEQAMERIKNSPITHYFLGSPCFMAESSLHVHF